MSVRPGNSAVIDRRYRGERIEFARWKMVMVVEPGGFGGRNFGIGPFKCNLVTGQNWDAWRASSGAEDVIVMRLRWDPRPIDLPIELARSHT